MPHDAKGNAIKVGDKVVIPATVIAVHPGEKFCNLDVELDYPMPPNVEKQRLSSLNTCQVEVIACGTGMAGQTLASAKVDESSGEGPEDWRSALRQ